MEQWQLVGYPSTYKALLWEEAIRGKKGIDDLTASEIRALEAAFVEQEGTFYNLFTGFLDESHISAFDAFKNPTPENVIKMGSHILQELHDIIRDKIDEDLYDQAEEVVMDKDSVRLLINNLGDEQEGLN